jgi:hypothetical protein
MRDLLWSLRWRLARWIAPREIQAKPLSITITSAPFTAYWEGVPISGVYTYGASTE